MEWHPSWDVVDSTKLSIGKTCWRKLFFSEVLGFKPEIPSIHLEHGIAWHLAMQTILENKDLPKEELLDKAIKAYMDHYMQFYSESDALANKPKDPATTYALLDIFLDQKKEWLKKIEVLHTEILGAIPITDTLALHVKIDAIVKDEKGIYLVDHKTTGRNSEPWRRHWSKTSQISAYIHALHAVYPSNEVYGAVIFGAVFKKDPEMVEIEVVKTGAQLQSWLASIQYWAEEYQRNFEWLSDEIALPSDPPDPIMYGFPCTDEDKGCTAYNSLCPYYGLCEAFPNPMELWGKPPAGYIVRRWDPREQDGKAEMKGGQIVARPSEDH